ncbi:hypothetical protein [Zavarzinella formosa]|uniref:hypothetical protein n=1 Tax=Zavarzinella formosa TaxID=360055 RepID=UPI00031BF83A|nr:hypothetical protein [Zavarzinella formosa]
MRHLPLVGLIVWAMPLLAAPPAEKGSPVELLLISGDRLSLLSIATELDRRPHADVWADAVAVIFADADVDGNGSLDATEAKRVLSVLRIRQLGWGYLWATPQAAEWRELDVSPVDGKVTRQELAAYYHRHLADAPQIGVGQSPPASLLTDALLKQLDANRDGQVSEAEWKNAEAALRSLDQDDDEMIRPGELVARTLYPGSAGGMMLSPGNSKSRPKLLADLPLARLPVVPGEPVILPSRKSKFAADANSDGMLDAEELAALRKAPGNVSIAMRLGTRKPGDTDPFPVGNESNGLRLFAYDVTSGLIDEFAAGRKTAVEKFAAADANGDGSLDAAEVKNAGYAPLRDHFAFADRNGDQRLSKAEWEAYLALRAKLVEAQAAVTIFDHGRGLFETLDTDGDGALSVRELRQAWSRLTTLKCFRDGRLDAAKLPHTIRMAASRGRPASLLRVPPRVGPEWFLAMDRNRDGDVSRREFIGGEEEFRKLDADQDGLISGAEAMPKKEK